MFLWGCQRKGGGHFVGFGGEGGWGEYGTNELIASSLMVQQSG
jgi:hypothetical protein